MAGTTRGKGGSAASDDGKVEQAEAQAKAEQKASRRKPKAKRPRKKAEPKTPVEVAVKESARKPKPKTARGVGRPSLSDQQILEIAQKTTLVTVTMLNGIAGALLGDKYRMNSYEEQEIKENLQATLEEMDIDRAAVIAKYSNPMMLALAVGAWGTRVAREYREDHADDDDGGSDQGPEIPTPPMPPEGEKEPESNHKSEDEIDGLKVVAVDHLRRPEDATLPRAG